jgi:SRSO17 transposase
LPEISKVVGVNSTQALYNFVAKSPWSVEKFKTRRLERTVEAVKGKAIKVIIDETEDRKKGNKTD